MSTTPEKSTEEQIIDKFDEIILNKLENKLSLDPNEQDHVTDILKNSVQTVPTAPKSKLDIIVPESNDVIVFSLIIFAIIIIWFFNKNPVLVPIASAAIGGVVGYLVPKSSQ
jgi:hypothetical protein